MNDAITNIVGKRTAGVIVKEDRDPSSQVFFLFDDQTHYEFYAYAIIHGIRAQIKAL